MTQPFLPFALPDITDREVEAVATVLRSGWITTGPKTQEFERKFSAAVGGGETVLLNSCTAAMHLALEAIGLKAGDEVIVPTLTFAATAEVVRYFDATPVLVDVRHSDHNIDPTAVERAITPRTRAILPVHFAGLPCEMDDIMQLARPRGLVVIDDAAHCFPCSYRGRVVGSLADITAFSFYATKTITTAEGGAAVTQNREWAERMRIMALHGISKDAWKRYSAEGSWYYEIVAPGYKYNMTDIAAAMGLVQLERASGMREARRAIAHAYDAAFARIDAFELIATPSDRDHAHHLYVLKLRAGALSVDRGQFINALRAKGIGSSVHFIPLHVHPYYRDRFGYQPDANPVALDLYERSVSLPIYSKMTESEVARVVGAVRDTARAFAR
jgi:perosamine synthetase